LDELISSELQLSSINNLISEAGFMPGVSGAFPARARVGYPDDVTVDPGLTLIPYHHSTAVDSPGGHHI
jgi:hypothetical protein